jgi:hypothetical protein
MRERTMAQPKITDEATREAMLTLFTDMVKGFEITIRKTREVTPADLKRIVQMSDDEVYVTHGHRMRDLFM